MNSQFVTVEISNDVFAELMKIAEERRVTVRVVAADIIEDSVKNPSPVKVQSINGRVFGIETDRNFLPPQELLDAGGGEISKMWGDMFQRYFEEKMEESLRKARETESQYFYDIMPLK